MSEPTANDVWTWLAECKKCGKPHEYRSAACTCGKPFHPHQMTWASPEDGHSYESRMDAWQVANLRRAFEQHLAEKDAS